VGGGGVKKFTTEHVLNIISVLQWSWNHHKRNR